MIPAVRATLALKAVRSTASGHSLSSDDVHHSVLAQSDIAADQPVVQSVAVHGEHALALFVGGSLAYLPAQQDAAGSSGREARIHPLPNEVALKLRQARHDGTHQLAAGGAEVEAPAGLRQDTDLRRDRISNVRTALRRQLARHSQVSRRVQVQPAQLPTSISALHRYRHHQSECRFGRCAR